MALPKLGSLPEASQLEIAEELGFDSIEEMAYSMGLTVAKLRRRVVKPTYKLAPELAAWEQLGITSEQAWTLSNMIQRWRANGETVTMLKPPHYGKRPKQATIEKWQREGKEARLREIKRLEGILADPKELEFETMYGQTEESIRNLLYYAKYEWGDRTDTWGTWLVCTIQRTGPNRHSYSGSLTRRYFWHYKLKHPRWYHGY